ncbi:MAG TPA: PPC domain-containing protein [Chthonomonadaceae bacterium]|nr:PPC domain-containing protein [Chthonomonadaceae bacterium]
MITWLRLRRDAAAAAALLVALAPVVAPAPARAQLHPPEVRLVYPLGGSAGLTTRVTISGVSFRNARQIVFDQPGITAKIVAPDFGKLPAGALDDDRATFVVADFTVDRSAYRDLYSFRIISDAGVSTAGKWMVGRELPQIEEKEPNNGRAQAQAVSLPIAINGHISDASDTDTFAVDLEAGKPFVAEVIAAQAGSPLDSLLTLNDANGAEVASNDDFGGPDSLLVYTPKASGRYYVTLSSSTGGGSGAHAYRLSLGALPLITGTLPGTLPRGRSVTVTPMGVNVPPAFPVTIPAGWRYGLAHVHSPEGVSSNGIVVGVSDLPLVIADGGNVDSAHAMPVHPPCAVNGKFYRSGSPEAASFYKFHADAGSRYVFDVQCQDRSGTRCDPVLTLYSPDGSLIVESDDSLGRDSHFDQRFVGAGDYTLRVKNLDATNSPDLVYQLLIQKPPPSGFSLTADTRARALGQGGEAAFDVQVSRIEWDGPVTLAATDLPPGVTASSEVVPAGETRGLVVLMAAEGAPLGGFPLRITGTGTVNGKPLTVTLTRATDRIWNGGAMRLEPAPVDTLYYAVTPPFEVTVKTDAAAEMTLGGSVKLHAAFQRRPGYDRAFTLNAIGLPNGIAAVPAPVAAGANAADLDLKALPGAKPGVYTIVLDAVTNNSPQVALDRVSAPITLTILPAAATGAAK